MKVDTVDVAGVMVATPAGRLDLSSYTSLRDTLLKLAADDPLALVVRLGPDFEIPSRAMLSVFTSVRAKIAQWPDIPLVLLAESASQREELLDSGVSRTVPTAGNLEEALTIAERPPHRGYRRVPLPNSPTAPIMARAVVREACDLWDLAGLTDDAVLVVSELVENAVRHAHSESVLRVELRPGGLSLAVRDGDPAPPVLTAPPSDLPGHRGVQLVNRISVAWGCSPSSDGGKFVWAVLGLCDGE